MLKSSTCCLLFWVISLFSGSKIQAQTPSTPNLPLCGTVDLSPFQTRSLIQQANQALQRKRASGAAFTAITYVPIRPHIIRQSNGTGGFSLASLNKVIAATNSYYLQNGLGIQFYFAGSTPDYIDNDDMYAAYNGQPVDAYDARNALNQYYVNQFSNTGLGGYAYYPDDASYSTRSFILTGSTEYDEDLGNRLIPHELGHTFNLIHTFGQNGGTGSLGSGVTTELVSRGAGANCDSAGDLICDTPADPYNKAGANFYYSNNCPVYDPSSTARDANGDPYSPSVTNIMSYYFPCTHDFTPGQYDRMQAGLALRQSHTSYTLDAPATNVTAPGNLTASVSGAAVVLTWQDNADNEMGYFIERSLSPASGFVPIGGVGPNVTTYTDNNTTARTHYYYRIRPSNTTTGSLSSTFDILVPAPVVSGLITTNITGYSAQLNWSNLGSNVTYDMQWRAVGSTSWNSYPNLSSTSYTLYSLTTNTAYEWQVKASSSDTYTGPVSFTTTCPVPAYPSSAPARSSAILYWTTNTGQTYTVQWRQQGSSTWNTVSGLAYSPYSLTGLTSATAYEWQVQGTCSAPPVLTSDFTSIQSFTTVSCQLPYNFSITDIFSASARVYWYDNYPEPTKTFDIRYRPVGTTDWTTVSSLTATSYGNYNLTGLSYNTQYEWQLRSNCSPTESSDFSSINTFTTICRTPTALYSTITATAAQLSWPVNYSTENGSTYEFQYRPVGTMDWITISGLISSSYSLTGLTTNTTYEWHVHSVCSASAQSDYSPTSTFTTRCSAPSASNLYAYFVTSASAQLSWYVPTDPNTHFDIQYRPVGAPNWTTISGLTGSTFTSNAYSLTGLTNSTTYEWQIRTICSPTESSTFTPAPTFTTQCRQPSYLYSYGSQVTSASLSWEQVSLDVTYEIRYRPVGAINWAVTTVNSNTTTSTILSGLTGNTTYEAQIRTRCSDGVYSDFTASYTFNTAVCSTPVYLYTYTITATSALLSWTFYQANVDTRYEARYRIVGTTDWITVSDLSSTNGTGHFTLTNLASSSQYEWQIRTICSATESSAFSASVLFQTLPPCDAMYTIRAGYWNDPAIWSCSRIPTSSDAVQIKHVITVPPNFIGTAKAVSYDAGQQVIITGNSQLKLGL